MDLNPPPLPDNDLFAKPELNQSVTSNYPLFFLLDMQDGPTFRRHLARLESRAHSLKLFTKQLLHATDKKHWIQVLDCMKTTPSYISDSNATKSSTNSYGTFDLTSDNTILLQKLAFTRTEWEKALQELYSTYFKNRFHDRQEDFYESSKKFRACTDRYMHKMSKVADGNNPNVIKTKSSLLSTSQKLQTVILNGDMGAVKVRSMSDGKIETFGEARAKYEARRSQWEWSRINYVGYLLKLDLELTRALQKIIDNQGTLSLTKEQVDELLHMIDKRVEQRRIRSVEALLRWKKNLPLKEEEMNGGSLEGMKEGLLYVNQPKWHPVWCLVREKMVKTWNVASENTNPPPLEFCEFIFEDDFASLQLEHCLDLSLCSVKPVNDNSNRRFFCFEIRSATGSLRTYQAVSDEDIKSWINTLNVSIAQSLQNFDLSDNMTLERLRNKHFANKFCAECGQKDPEWCSLNLGILLCIECAGVHRGLGCHISQIRSLKLDKLPSNLEIDNSNHMNNEEEQSRCRQDRVKYIRNKYLGGDQGLHY